MVISFNFFEIDGSKLKIHKYLLRLSHLYPRATLIFIGQLVSLRGSLYHFLDQQYEQNETWLVYKISEKGSAIKLETESLQEHPDWPSFHPIPYYKRFYNQIEIIL